MKILHDLPIIILKQSDQATAWKKTWVAKRGAIWVVPDDAILVVPNSTEVNGELQ